MLSPPLTNLILRLEASQGLYQNAGGTVPAVNDGDPIGKWTDLIGNNSPAQGSAPAKPKLKSIWTNGQPAVQFDGAASHLLSGLIPVQPFTVVLAGQLAVGGANQYYIDGQTLNTAVVSNLGQASKRGLYAGASLLYTPVVDGSPEILTAVFDGVTSVFRYNGFEVDGDGGIGPVVGGTTVGASGALSNFLNGYIGTGLIYSGHQSGPAIVLAESYLSLIYGISIYPISNVPPIVFGTGTTGQVVSTTNGTWYNAPTSYAYAWRRDGTPIGGATSSTYTMASADIGHVIDVTVTATNVNGSSVAVPSGNQVTGYFIKSMMGFSL